MKTTATIILINISVMSHMIMISIAMMLRIILLKLLAYKSVTDITLRITLGNVNIIKSQIIPARMCDFILACSRPINRSKTVPSELRTNSFL